MKNSFAEKNPFSIVKSTEKASKEASQSEEKKKPI